MESLNDIWIIARRDLLRNIRQKSTILNAFIRPVLWLFLLGAGLKQGFAYLPLGLDLQKYIFPGIIAMNIAFSGVMSGASIVWDREFGFLKQVLVAPVARSSVLLGKMLSGTIIASIHGLIVLLMFPILGMRVPIPQILLTLLSIWVVSFAMTSIGVLLAVNLKTIEGFGTINNFLVFPMFFLSGAMYPPDNIPMALRFLTLINPLTYGVNLLRGILLGIQTPFLTDLLVLLYLPAIALFIALWCLKKDGR